jgi:hypothetical protein
MKVEGIVRECERYVPGIFMELPFSAILFYMTAAQRNVMHETAAIDISGDLIQMQVVSHQRLVPGHG